MIVRNNIIIKIILLLLFSNIFFPFVAKADDPWAGLKDISINNKEDSVKYCEASGFIDNIKMMRCDITVFDPKGAPTKFQFDAIKKTYSDFILVNDKRLDMDVKLKLNYTPGKEDYSLDGTNFFYKEYGGGNKTEYGEAGCKIITHCCCAFVKDAAGKPTADIDEKNCKQTFCNCNNNQRDISFCGVAPKAVPINGINTETIDCGAKKCIKTNKGCSSDSDCKIFSGIGVCKNSFCFLDDIGLKKYQDGEIVETEQTKELKIVKPVLEINIPQLNFSDVANNIDSEGFLHLPYIGEYMKVIYNVSMVFVSIIGVIMIIVVGVKITVLGGQERVEGFKKIGQIVIGLFIAWGSYSILYTINPALVNFDVLRVEYIQPQIATDPSEPDGDGGAGDTKRLCDNRTACAPYCSKKNTLPSYSTLNGADPTTLTDVKKWFKNHDSTPVGLTFTTDAFLKSPAVTALQKAGENAASKGYIIRIQSTYRSLEGQLEKYCTHFQPPDYLIDKPDNPYKPSELAWPGGSNHGAGIAIDITLLKDGAPVAGYAKKDETGPAFEDLKSIMFSSGWVRLKSERWHYEFWGGTAFPDTRCNDC